MYNLSIKHLRSSIAEYARPSTNIALVIFMADITIYTTTVAGAVFLENIIPRMVCSMLAGLLIALLFVVAHDAAHDSFTSSRTLNKVIARISYLPCLHNYSLWLIAHNRMHHQLTNLKGENSWSPLSKKEYDDLPVWRKLIERFYRSPAGICFNYLIERWWKNKFYPYLRNIRENRAVYWLDFLLVATYLLAFLWLAGYAGYVLKHTTPLECIIYAFVIPFLFSCFMIGASVYQQHTHESIPWFASKTEFRKYGKQQDITMHVIYPRWYNLISHNVMEHTAHHIDPRVPLYNLAKAQHVLHQLLGNKMVKVSFTLHGFLQTMSKCKLYDYEKHCWLDFTGQVTSKVTINGIDNMKEVRYRNAA